MREIWDRLPKAVRVALIVLAIYGVLALIARGVIFGPGGGGAGQYNDCGADYGFTTGC